MTLHLHKLYGVGVRPFPQSTFAEPQTKTRSRKLYRKFFKSHRETPPFPHLRQKKTNKNYQSPELLSDRYLTTPLQLERKKTHPERKKEVGRVTSPKRKPERRLSENVTHSTSHVRKKEGSSFQSRGGQEGMKLMTPASTTLTAVFLQVT